MKTAHGRRVTAENVPVEPLTRGSHREHNFSKNTTRHSAQPQGGRGSLSKRCGVEIEGKFNISWSMSQLYKFSLARN